MIFLKKGIKKDYPHVEWGQSCIQQHIKSHNYVHGKQAKGLIRLEQRLLISKEKKDKKIII